MPAAADAETPADRFAPALAGVALVALIGRITYLVRSGVDRVATFHQGDAFWYSTVAQALADGSWFTNPFTGQPTADHPPVTVLLLAPASALFDSTFAQRMTMVLLGTVAVVVVGLAGRRLAGPGAGLAAAALAALSPSLWVNDVLIMSETPTALAVAGLLWAGIVLAERPTVGRAAAVGALCGLATLTRAETGLFLPFMVWPLVLRAPGLGRRVRLQNLAVATAATAAVIAPWSLSNLPRFDEPVAISTNDGLTLLGANCDLTYHGAIVGGWTLDGCTMPVADSLDSRKPPLPAGAPTTARCVDERQHRPPCWDASSVSREMRSEAFAYIRANLDDQPRLAWFRNGRVWGWYGYEQSVGIGSFEGRGEAASRWGFITTWLMVPLVVAGGVVLRRRGRSLVPFVAALAVVVVTTTAFYGLVRFRVPYDVAACLVAGTALAEGARRLDRLRSGRSGVPAPAADGS